MMDLIYLFLINIVPFAIFVVIGQKYYFNIISNSNIRFSRKNKNYKIQANSKIVALTKKELKRYFSSTVYIFNSSFGLLLGLAATIMLVLQGDELMNTLSEQLFFLPNISFTILFYFLILFTGSMTSITSSSISLEGKTIDITKSLPVKEQTILNSKILLCYVIELPFILVSSIIYIIKFTPGLLDSLILILLSFSIIGLNACIGLIANLKYPKLNASSDTEVVKQSISSTVSVFIGMGIFIGSFILMGFLSKYISIQMFMLLHSCIITVLSLILYFYLMKKGRKLYRSIVK